MNGGVFPGLNQYYDRMNVSYSRTQNSDASESLFICCVRCSTEFNEVHVYTQKAYEGLNPAHRVSLTVTKQNIQVSETSGISLKEVLGFHLPLS